MDGSPHPITAEQRRFAGLRSFATNLPFGIVVVAAIAAIHQLIDWRTEPARRNAFLKALAASNAPNSVLVACTDAADPLDLAARHLAHNPDETGGPIRTALAATF